MSAATTVPSCATRPQCRHRPLDVKRGDQSASTHALAIQVALLRAPLRGRQRVTKHVGPVLVGWFVQDVDAQAVTA